MNKNNVKRNQACPCGSGLKYKKCCLQRFSEIENFHDNYFNYYNNLVFSFKLKLDDYYQASIRRIKKDLQFHFLRFSIEKTFSEQTNSIFSDFLWFDAKQTRELSFAQTYIQEMEDSIAKEELAILNAMQASYLSIYSIIELEQDIMMVKDIFTSQEHKIFLKEPLIIENASEILLLGRLFEFSHATMFSGMVLMLKNTNGEIDFIKKHIAYLHSLYPEKSTQELLKSFVAVTYAIFEHAQKKRLINLRDLRYINLNQEQYKVLQIYFAANPDYTLEHTLADFFWYRPSNNNRGYQRYLLNESRLLLCTDVLEDLENMSHKVLDLLLLDKFEFMHSQFYNQPPSAELIDIWFLVLKDQEYERWLITPHEEFNGNTPQELLQEKSGKERILKALDKIANESLNEEIKVFTQYIKNRLT